MRTSGALWIAVAAAAAATVLAQEPKPVPKDSVRVHVSGCAKGYAFTVGPTIAEEVNGPRVPEGTHMRLNGPKKLIAEIDAYKTSMVQITGLVKKGQYAPGGLGLGGGVQISSAPAPGSGGLGANPVTNTVQIDVEGWSPATGQCPSE